MPIFYGYVRAGLAWLAALGLLCACSEPAATGADSATDVSAADAGHTGGDLAVAADSDPNVDTTRAATDAGVADATVDAGAGDIAADGGPDAPTADSQVAATDAVAAKCPADCPKPSSVCQYAVCDPGLGCVYAAVADAVLCDDNNPCTQGLRGRRRDRRCSARAVRRQQSVHTGQHLCGRCMQRRCSDPVR